MICDKIWLMSECCHCRVCLIKERVDNCIKCVDRGDLVVGDEIMSDLLKNDANIELLGFELLSRVIVNHGSVQRFVLENLGKIEGQIKTESFVRKKEEIGRFLDLT